MEKYSLLGIEQIRNKITILLILSLISIPMYCNQYEYCTIDSLINWLDERYDKYAEISEMRNECIFYYLSNNHCDELLNIVFNCDTNKQCIFFRELSQPLNDDYSYDVIIYNISTCSISDIHKHKCIKILDANSNNQNKNSKTQKKHTIEDKNKINIR